MKMSIEGIRDPRIERGAALTGWAIVKPGPSHWYHVSRVVFLDGEWFEVYWHGSLGTRGKSKAAVREYAKNTCALVLLPDVYTAAGGLMNKLKVLHRRTKLVQDNKGGWREAPITD